MITSIRMENFLSYDDVTIPMGPLTIMCGCNLSGKTNVLRALQWCLLNVGGWSDDPKRNSIRRQVASGALADYTRVCVSFDDGLAVERHRNAAGANEYTVTRPGEDTIHIGGEGTSVGLGFSDAVAEIAAMTGVGGVLWPGAKTRSFPQFQTVTDPRFLLADSGESADLKLGVIMGTGVMEEATKTAGKEAKAASQLRTALQAEREKLQDEIALYDGIDECVSLGAECDAAQERAAATADAHKLVGRLVADLDAAAARVTTLAGADTLLAAVDDVANQIQVTDQAKAIAASVATWANGLSECASAASVPVDEIDALLVAVEQQMRVADDAKQAAGAVATVAARLDACGAAAAIPVDELDALLVDIQRVQDDTAGKRALLLRAQGAVLALTSAREQVQLADDLRVACQSEINAIMNSVTVCPVTGEPETICPFGEDNQI